MRRNIYKFSGAKSFVQLAELNQRLTKDGKIIPWEDFKAEALKLNDKYNVNYLQAEYQTAKQGAYHAANWEVYERDKKRFPNLKYKTQNDDRVRDEHRALHGIIAPIGSDFWKKYYPPNGWRCRCYVVQSAETPSKDIPEDLPDVKPEFRINTGIGGQIFSEGDEGAKPAPYFSLAKTGGIEKAFEMAKEYAPLETVHKAKNGAKVTVNIFADEKDLESNVTDAIVIADQLGINVNVRPNLNGKMILKANNAEYDFDGKLGDRKSPEGKSPKRLLRKAVKQQCEVVVFNLENFPGTEDDFMSVLKKHLRYPTNYPLIREFIVITRKKAKFYKREDFLAKGLK